MPGPAEATHGVGGVMSAMDQELAGELAVLAPELIYSVRLARAAHAMAVHVRPPGTPDLPLAFSEFVLHWAGWPAPTASTTVVYTTEDDQYDLWSQLALTLEDRQTVGWTHIGIGRAPAAFEPYRWIWVVFLAQLTIDLDPVPTTIEPGGSVVITYRLPDEFESSEVVLSRPGGIIDRRRADDEGGIWRVQVDVGRRRGRGWLEVVARQARSGPKVVALFPLWVGVEPARVWRGRSGQETTDALDDGAAERLIVTLVNEERQRIGLAALELEPALTEIARRHSRDMAANGFVGHVGSDGGTLRQRLAAEDYRYLRSAENVSRSPSITEAHAGLMRSPGHRANILDPDVTHLGVGVVSVNASPDRRELHVTQLFASPIVPPQPLELSSDLRLRIAERRNNGSLPAVRFPRDVQRAAEAVARRVVGALESVVLVDVAAEELSQHDVRWAKLAVEAKEIATPVAAPLPDRIDEPGVSVVGVGVAAPERDSEQALPVVVYLLIEPAG